MAHELADLDAAYVNEKESVTSQIVESDKPAEWLANVTEQASEWAAADAAFLDAKVEGLTEAKAQADYVDPTKDMDEKEKKEYHAKVLSDAKANERGAAAAAKAAAKALEAAEKEAAKLEGISLKKKEAAEAAKADAKEASKAAKEAADAAAAAAEGNAVAQEEEAAATKATEAALAAT